MLPVEDEKAQRNFENVEKTFAQKKDVALKKLRRFDGLNSKLADSIGELEQAVSKDTDGKYYSLKVIDGKLFRGSELTEIT